MPRDAWRIEVDIIEVADLTSTAMLHAHGIRRLRPARAQWPQTQLIGEAYWAGGSAAVLAPSAAHVGGTVLAVFRAIPGPIAGVDALPPPTRYAELPQVPQGLRT